jgi:hypothetical protein
MELMRVHNFQLEVLPEVLALKPFNAIFKRDKGYSTDGKRVKIQYIKELLFVYFSAKYNSNYLKYGEKQRIDKLKEVLLLPADWKPDRLIEEAIAFYKEEQSAQATDLLMTLSKGLAISKTIIEMLINKMQKQVDELTFALENATEVEDFQDISVQIALLMDDMEKLMDISAKVPTKTIDQIKKLEIEAAKEQSEKNRIRGDKDVDKWQLHPRDRKD